MVRVALDDQQLRGARISLLSALGAGAVIVLAWMMLREPPQPAPVQRSLVDCRVPWACERDPAHRFTESGRFEPRPCPVCEGRCFIELEYVCPACKNRFRAFVQFKRTGDANDPTSARESVFLYRYSSDEDWKQTSGYVPCPIESCGAKARRPHTSWSEQSLRNPHTALGD